MQARAVVAVAGLVRLQRRRAARGGGEREQRAGDLGLADAGVGAGDEERRSSRRRPRRSPSRVASTSVELVGGDRRAAASAPPRCPAAAASRRACALAADARADRARRRRTLGRGRDSSMPTIMPRWRISPTCASGASSPSRRGVQLARSSAAAARASRSRSNISSDASAAAQASGLPVYVWPWKNVLQLGGCRGRPRRSRSVASVAASGR